MGELIDCKACDGTGKVKPVPVDGYEYSVPPFASAAKTKAILDHAEAMQELTLMAAQGICAGCHGTGKQRI